MELVEIENALMRFLKENILDENVKLDKEDTLSNFGVDSYSIVEILLFIERKFGFILPDSKLKPENFKSVSSIALVVYELVE